MAAATNLPAGPVTAAVLAFLQAATAVFASAWTRQSLAEDGDVDGEKGLCVRSLAELGEDLRVAVATIEQANDSDLPHPLLHECVKIGKDVGLRLDRLATDASFTWELVDLVVLGERLDRLVQRAHHFDKSPLPAEELHRLERQLAVRLAPNAPALDEFYNGEPPGKANADLPVTLRRKQTRGPRGQAAPEILHDFILEALAYKSMRDREDEVTEAHASTLDWVFADGQHGLKTWLSTEAAGPVYWITGKPGSGKSTFMRHLARHETTARCLEAWAGGDAAVLVAGFFFWTGGAREQRSRAGLLRSLLHELLAAGPPGLAAAAFPDLWARLRGMSTQERVRLRLAWTAEELLAALHALVAAAAAGGTSVCLFVDGMDELEGDHAAVVELFRGLAAAAAGRVKMCLSSRPWAVFRDAFAFTVPNLRLQELTRGDMRRYVAETLARDGKVGAILEREGEKGAQFVDEIVDRADGVFLWVRLAVEKILERSAAADGGVGGLARLLAALPADLDALFAKLLLEDQTAAELAQTAVLYGLMRAREQAADFVRNDDASNLTVWELAFALDEADDQMILDKLAVEEATDDLVRQRAEATIHTIKQRFSGLLGLHVRSREGNLLRSGGGGDGGPRERARARVVYVHRTVRDWLLSGPGGAGQPLPRPADPDPDLRLLRSYVLRMKRPLGTFARHRVLDDWWPDITLALTHARRAARDPDGLQRAMVGELDATIGRWWLPRHPGDHWARGTFGTFEARAKAAPIRRPFLCLAVRFGLRAYVAAELAAATAASGPEEEEDLSAEMRRALRVQDDDDDDDDDDDGAVPLLAYATEFLCSRRQTVYPASDPALVEEVLRRGATGPDDAYRDFATRAETTAWLATLRHLRDARRRRWIGRYDADAGRWARVVRLLLEVGGADPRAVVRADAWDPEITAEGVLEMLDETYNDVEIRGLRDLLRGLLRETGKSA